MEKIWLKSYPSGVPAEINPDAYQSITDVFDQSCKEFKNNPAYYNMGKTLTFGEIDHYSRCFTNYLQQTLKVKKGSRIAIMLPNLLQYPIAMLGAFRAGLVVVNVNPLYTATELQHQLNDAEVETIVVLSNFAHTLEVALPNVKSLKNIIVTSIGDMLSPLKGMMIDFVLKYIYRKVPAYDLKNAISFKHILANGDAAKAETVPVTNGDIAFLQYTGGTTGVAKGAVLTHRNMIANMQQADAWCGARLKPGKEIIITALPLYHIFSLTANCLFFAKIGGLNVLITNPRDLPAMVKEIRKFKFTAITGVNTLFNALLNNAEFKKLDFSALRLSLGGGMAVQRAVAEKWKKLTGKPILEAYGLTETSPCVTINPTDHEDFNGSIGLPVSSTNVCVMDEEHHILSIGEEGELAVKGPQVMKGYWNNETETKKVFTEDGWLLTGDIAKIDEDGYVYLLERKKDMILVSGFNVYPNEVEDVIAQMEGVKEVAVVAIPDENSGEVPKAFIVQEGNSLTKEAVIAFARKSLTGYKVPKEIAFVDELPKTNVGKILRRELRDKTEA